MPDPPRATRVTVLGSGDAFSGCGCNAATVVGSHVLVDCGAPVHVLLPRAGLSPASLELVLLTHFHADHSFMLPVLLGALAFDDGAGERGLCIAGPAGTRELVHRLLLDGYGAELLELIDHRIAPTWQVLQDGDDLDLCGNRVTAHAVVHSTGPSLAYTVQPPGGAVIGLSGDSAMCPGLERVIAASDLVVCECTGWEGPTVGGHLWRGEVEELIARHPRTRFLLSHLRQRGTVPGAFIAHDLLSLDVLPEQGPENA